MLKAPFVVGIFGAALATWFLAWALPLSTLIERLGIAAGYLLLLGSVILYGISWWKGRGTPIRW